MPELPEVQTIVSELNRRLKNKTISRLEVRTPKMIAVGPSVISNRRQVKSYQVIKFIKLLNGQKILSVKRRAKLLIFDFSGPLSMLVHLKMTGQFIFENRKQQKKTGGYYRIINKLTAPKVLLPSKYTHVIFYFKDGSHLFYNDVRQFGYLKLVMDSEIDQVRELGEFGPEPLEPEFTIRRFETAVSKRRMGKIKQVLMDPKVVAGIGNIYSDEILFHAKVRPTRAVSSLSPKELKAVYNAIRPVLIKGIKAKGSSVGDFVRTDGSWGQMGKYHFVYGRWGEKCKRCGTNIQRVTIGGRTGSFCPKCQR